MIDQKLKAVIRDVADFPKPGIVFKDITPILKDATLCNEVVDAFVDRLEGVEFDLIAGVESRGFLFGLMLSVRLGVPFVPIRKKGKLPYQVVSKEYALEYGAATIEVHEDAFLPGAKVLLHDDLLATGGTLEAASALIEQLGGEVAGYTFVINLSFLDGDALLAPFSDKLISLVDY